MYKYKTDVMPQSLLPKDGRDLPQELAFYIQNKINEYAQDGWEFYRTDEYTVTAPAGCFMALLGQTTAAAGRYNVLVFRKETEHNKD